MLYSKLFAKTSKSEVKGDLSINAKLLTRGGFIDQLMSGSYTLLPLGFRVVKKIEQIIREEMDKTGAQELLMPLLHPKEIWNETGRWEKAKDVMYQFKKGNKEFALSFTHEEIVLDLIRKHTFSYKEYPIKIYHFSTKFRDELRAKSGVLRTREFLMKDLYSAHTSERDLDKYYWQVAEAYQKIFKRMNLNAKIVEAGGGVFTDGITHEFQVICNGGEDVIYFCQNCDFAQNKDIAKVEDGSSCPKCGHSTGSGQGGPVKGGHAVEVGNIFRFGTSYSEKMGVCFTDEKGNKKYPYFASYGIGLTRLMGTLVEMFHDEKGIIWPEQVAPFDCHLLTINNQQTTNNRANDIYDKLQQVGIEVLYDDRKDVSAGEKFADCDLIGIPYRVVVSKKTQDKLEVKKRSETATYFMDFKELLNELSN